MENRLTTSRLACPLSGWVLAIGASGFILPAAAQGVAKIDPKPNILIIIADQLSQQALATFGDRSMSTPTIDATAACGVTFANSYTASPLSMPSRAALWTGQYPHTTGIVSNGRHWPTVPVSTAIPTLGETFSANGYQCMHFGKRHDNGTLRGFNVADDIESIVPDEHPEFPLAADSYRDVNTRAKAIEFLSGVKNSTQPFVCVVDLNNPHEICSYVGAFKGAHKNPAFPEILPPLPPNFDTPDMATRSRSIQYMCCSHRRLAQAAQWSPDNYRHYLAAYYYYAGRLDRDINAVMQALANSGRADNTLIVILADHGDGMAAHRMVTKQGSMYDQTTRVPLIFSGATVAKNPRPIDVPLVNVSLDLFPTLCDMAGIAAPQSLPGRSLKGWITGKPTKHDTVEYVCSEWVTEWGYTVSPSRMIRTRDYKYIRYMEDRAEELYNLRTDPLEQHNIAGNSKYTSVLEHHRKLLRDHIDKSNDNFESLHVVWSPKMRNHVAGYQNHRGASASEIK